MRRCLMMLALVALAACGQRQEPAAMAEPVVCGGAQAMACGAGQYCALPQTGFCGVGGETGICMPKPQACTMQYDPVCGCDGQTYPTSCAAAAEGVSVASTGECWDSPQ